MGDSAYGAAPTLHAVEGVVYLQELCGLQDEQRAKDA